MSTLITRAYQIGISATANQNFNLACPNVPDGTITFSRGNAGASSATVFSVDGSNNITLGGKMTAPSGNFQAVVPGAIGQFDMVGGSGSAFYNAGWRNDGSTVYLLSSAVQTTLAAAQSASWNSGRPFQLNLSTGALTIGSAGVPTSFGSSIQGPLINGSVSGSGIANANLIISNVSGTGDANVALMSFLCNATYGVNMHLRADGYFGIGGWSASAWKTYINLGTGDFYTSGDVMAYSDPRLKREIKIIPNALAKVKSLDGVDFRWIEHERLGRSGQLDVGILSTQVAKVLPSAVSTSSIELDGVHYDSVAYTKLVPLLVEAIKEQSSLMDDQERRLHRQSSHISELKEMVSQLTTSVKYLSDKIGGTK